MKGENYLEELKELQRMENSLKKASLLLPHGRIYSQMARGKYPQYYLASEEEGKRRKRGRYISVDEIDTVAAYVQGEYIRQMIKEVSKLEQQLEKVISFNEINIYEVLNAVYEKIPEPKRRIVKPAVLSDDDFVEKWLNSFVTDENSFPKENKIETERGELVRSKSEKIIADKLFSKGIPYVYEARLTLKGNIIVYPDFTTLNIRKRKTYYHEHFGMMDDPEYCKKALEKLDLYEDNGIILGENLFATFETSKKIFSIRTLDRIIKQNLL